ncbi:MAG: aldehyde ferredoxin oxidoreductase [Nitrososphaeria archaeon]|nr:aldehyde ferredoxin oxidoreductase [Nitrososphaeria archaeon]NIQ34308.1 aldehyde ferredoxin oxidoreductase [Nitrososphaeria archaeon]
MKNNEVYGWAGKILRVDLDSGHTSREPTLKYAKKFLGGRGINWGILYSEIKTGTDALSPENMIGIGTGILTGTLTPAACRSSLDMKSPLTHAVGSADVGGHWGPELKFAGYDNILIRGRSKNPVYLWIDDEHVEPRDARKLWGMTTWETPGLIREELGDQDIQVLCIGPAGENLCMGACVIANNGRAAGRCGVGAVWGSKNLKAIAVRGTGSVEVAKPEEFIQTVDRFYETLVNDAGFQGLSKFGTAGWVIGEAAVGAARPFKNSQDTYWPDYFSKSGGRLLVERYQVRRLACFSCPVHCSQWVEVDEGPFSGLKGEAYEANTDANWGFRVGVDYLPATIKLHILCNQLGLDIDIPSVTVAWAMECYQRGILTKEDTEGLDLTWGNYEAIIELLHRIAYRKGRFANILADGVKRASEKIGRGSEKYAMHVKGQDLYEEGRVGYGYALGAATSTRCGTHTRGSVVGAEFGHVPSEVSERVYGVPTASDKWNHKGKGKLVVYTERCKGIFDSLGVCVYVTNWWSPYLMGPDMCAELVTAATGWRVTGKELLNIGERIQNVEKAFNVREVGFTRKDDSLPDRFFEPIPSGPMKGLRLEREKWEEALNEYYREHRWDIETGLQTKECLENLDLKELVDDLEKIGKLTK